MVHHVPTTPIMRSTDSQCRSPEDPLMRRSKSSNEFSRRLRRTPNAKVVDNQKNNQKTKRKGEGSKFSVGLFGSKKKQQG